MIDTIILHYSAKTTCSAKIRFSIYGPKWYKPIRLLDFSNLNISKMA